MSRVDAGIVDEDVDLAACAASVCGTSSSTCGAVGEVAGQDVGAVAELGGQRLERLAARAGEADDRALGVKRRAMAPPMPPLAPVTSARLPVSSNMRFPSLQVQASLRERRVDVAGRADGERLGALGDPLGEPGEHLAGADLDEGSRRRRRRARRSISRQRTMPVTCSTSRRRISSGSVTGAGQ